MFLGAEISPKRVSAPGFAVFTLVCLFALPAIRPAAAYGTEPRTAAAAAPADLFGGAPVSGDWVVYRDLSWPAPTWVGFISYDGSTWGAFLKTPSSGSDVRILFRTEEADRSLILTGQNIISSIRQSDVEAVNYLMGLLPEIWKWSAEAAASRDAGIPSSVKASSAGSSLRSDLLPAAYAEKRNLPDFGGAVTLSWAGEIPVFALASLTGAAEKPIMSLERTGRAASSADTAFFEFESVSETLVSGGTGPENGNAAAGRDPALTAGTTEAREIDGLKLKLDGNWTMYADNTYFMGNDAVLIAASAESESLGIQAGSGLSAVPPALYALFTRSSASAWEVPGNRSLSGTANRFRIENLFYDPETGKLTRDIKLCLPSKNAKGAVTSVRIVSLSVSDAVYRANPGYFNGILPQ